MNFFKWSKELPWKHFARKEPPFTRYLFIRYISIFKSSIIFSESVIPIPLILGAISDKTRSNFPLRSISSTSNKSFWRKVIPSILVIGSMSMPVMDALSFVSSFITWIQLPGAQPISKIFWFCLIKLCDLFICFNLYAALDL